MKRWYTWGGLWSLFLACVFPIQLWVILLSLSDFQWVAERTNAWDAVGVISYGLLFGLFESLVIFVAVAAAGFLIAPTWDEPRRVAVMSTLILVLSLWAMYEQATHILNLHLPRGFLDFLASTGHPVRYLYMIYFVPVLISVALPVWLLLRNDKVLRFARAAFERMGVLSGFYLLLDLAGIAIVVSRNV